ncbi:MAG: alginate O-acetyltransferase complex protein AlgJ [Halieaceae bacterium]
MYFSTSTFEMTNRRLLVLFFTLASALLLVVAVWNWSHWSWRESRRFVAGDFSAKVNLVFKGQGLSPRISNWLYQQGISTRPKYVVVGQDGWMYLGDKFESVASKAAGHYSWPDPPAIDRWKSQLLARQQWLESQGVVSLFAIAPNKHSIYPENGPSWLPFRSPALTPHLVMQAKAKDISIVDSGPVIAAQRCCMDWLYTKTDSHWTLLGAYFAYLDIMQEITAQIPGLVVLPDASVSFGESRLPGGGLDRMLGIDGFYRGEVDPGYSLRILPVANKLCVRKTSRAFRGTKKCEAVGDINMPAGIRTVNRLSNPDALNDLSVLIVGDSFSLGPSRYFNHSFSTVWHAHLGYILNGERLKTFVQKFKPDVVLYLVVERNILRPLVYEFDGQSNITAPIIE